MPKELCLTNPGSPPNVSTEGLNERQAEEPGAGSGSKEALEQARLYQLEVLELAKKENVIVYMRTGAGKTHIAALLVDHVLEKACEEEIVAFVVPQVPLVRQQADYLKKVSRRTIEVLELFGDMGVDYWGREKWQRELRKADVMVMTAQILLNALRHALISIDIIPLLIFDECHHATKSHAYNFIMREFYHELDPRGKRPRIFGMTASPVKDNQAFKQEEEEREDLCQQAMEELEQNLDASIVILSKVSEGVLDAAVAKPEEFVLFYEPSRASQLIEGNMSYKKFQDRLKEAEDRVVRDMDQSEGTGPRYRGDKTRKRGTRKDAEFVCEYISGQLGELASHAMLSRIIEGRPFEKYPDLGAGVSDKAYQLLRILCAEYKRWKALETGSSFQCIVFVTRRCLAWILAQLINWCMGDRAEQELHAEAITGWGCRSPSEDVRAMTRKRQLDILTRFRKAEFGILVSTDVLEEGIDVPSCGLVMIFEELPSVISYIQGRGRARHACSRYIVLAPKQDPDYLERLRHIKDGSQCMQFVAGVRRKCEAGRRQRPIFEQEPTLYSKTTKARVPLSASVSLVHRYCDTLPCDEKFGKRTCWRPYFDTTGSQGRFKCKVTLPIDAAVRRGSCVEPQSSMRNARAHACLDVYKKLYDAGEVDEHLLPVIGSEQETGHDDQEERRDRRNTFEVIQPDAISWDDSQGNEVHLYLVVRAPDKAKHMDCANLSMHGIITSRRILDEDLESLALPEGKPLLSLRWMKSFALTEDQYDLATKYARRVRVIGINSRELFKTHCKNSKESTKRSGLRDWFGKPGFLFVPLTPKSSDSTNVEIAWEQMKELVSFDFCKFGDAPTRKKGDVKELEHAIVQSRHDKERLVVYFTYGRTPELSLASPINPRHLSEALSKKYSSYHEYYRDGRTAETLDATQPVIDGVTEFTSNKRWFPLVPELCRVVPISKHGISIALDLPKWQAFMATSDSYRRMSFRRRCSSIVDFSRALTPRTTEHDDSSLNYERLEFLGDAVLKYFASLYVFLKYPTRHQGVLSRERDRLVRNDKLYDIALAKDLHNVLAYFSSSAELRKFQFYLASQEQECVIPTKRLADIIEALLGLDFGLNGLGSTLSLADEFGFTEDEDLKAIINKPFAWPPGRCLKVPGADDAKIISCAEEKLGYQFKDKVMLLEALTHGSHIKAKTQSYQRWEFLGDAVLCLVITEYLYKKHPDWSPAQLTMLRSIAISNELFGRALVNLGIHEYMIFRSLELKQCMNQYLDCLKDEDAEERVIYMLEVECPKVLGDIFEAIVGAIFVDCSNDLTKVWKLFQPRLLPLFERFCHPSVLEDPVTKCVHVVQRRTGRPPTFRHERLDCEYLPDASLGSANEEGTMTVCKLIYNGDIEVCEAKGVNYRRAKQAVAKKFLEMEDREARKTAAAKKAPVSEHDEPKSLEEGSCMNE